MIRVLIFLPLLGLAAACNTAADPDADPAAQALNEAPPGAAPGTCWGKIVTPAVIETVTDQIVVQPARLAEDGSVITPATYRTETRQQIVEERRTTWFETPCADRQTPEFVASLQRALRARGLYSGAADGRMDAPTRAALRRYQAPRGLDSSILSLRTARELGLVAVDLTPD